METVYDAVVVGAGPAGAIAAMYLKRSGKHVILLDKARFPRDKTCGDAQGRKLAGVMQDLGIYGGYEKLQGQPIYGMRLSSPNGIQIDMDLIDRMSGTPGYIVRRKDLDNFLVRQAKKCGVDVQEGVAVLNVAFDGAMIKELACKGPSGPFTVRAKIYIAADGANSIVAKSLNLKNPPEHFIVALRAYYRNVKGLSDRIELHLLKNVIPGYFWIFPLPNNEANVGLGIVVKIKNRKNISLLNEFTAAVKENPLFRERFAGAEMLGTIKAWNLPVASYRRKCYGPNYLLVGDAAGLIDPLSGEGVGTAAISARHAAAVVIEALDSCQVNESFLSHYSTNLWNEIGDEIRADYRIQRLGHRFPFLLNRLMKKAERSPEFRKKLESLLPYTEGKGKIGTWRFIASLFF